MTDIPMPIATRGKRSPISRRYLTKSPRLIQHLGTYRFSRRAGLSCLLVIAPED